MDLKPWVELILIIVRSFLWVFVVAMAGLNLTALTAPESNPSPIAWVFLGILVTCLVWSYGYL